MNAKQRQSLRIRCFGHIVNLCAHALIFGKGKGSRHDQLAKAERQGNEEASAAVWRNVGAVGRLHNIVKYIRWSPKRREDFVSYTKGGKLAEYDDLEVCLYSHYFNRNSRQA